MLRLKGLVKSLFLSLFFVVISITQQLYASENVHLPTNLRVDLSEVIYSRDYRLFIRATVLPASYLNPDTSTSGWLSVDLGNNAGFSQVGLVAYPSGLRWFAISFYYFTKASNRGTVAVTIDGINYGTINQCSTSGTQWQASQSFTGLTSDVHTIHVARVGTSSGCTDGYIDVDKLVPQA